MSQSAAQSGDRLKRTVEIINRRGLHARAAAKFVETADSFSAEIAVTCCGQTVSGRSIMGLMMLAASPGCTIDIETAGEGAPQAMDALVKLIGNRFDEDA